VTAGDTEVRSGRSLPVSSCVYRTPRDARVVRVVEATKDTQLRWLPPNQTGIEARYDLAVELEASR
jgi:hypothetical protein